MEDLVGEKKMEGCESDLLGDEINVFWVTTCRFELAAPDDDGQFGNSGCVSHTV